MKKFTVHIHREVTFWQMAAIEIEAESLDAARAEAGNIVDESNECAPDETIESDPEFGGWSIEDIETA